MLNFTPSTLVLAAALVAVPSAFASSAFACGGDDKDDKKEDSVLSVDSPSCGGDEGKDDKKEDS